jgi:hypothetical protein
LLRFPIALVLAAARRRGNLAEVEKGCLVGCLCRLTLGEAGGAIFSYL